MEKLWSILLHFGTNMWNEEGNTKKRENEPDAVASSTLRFSRELFRETAILGAQNGLNAIILDIGEAMKYESHPELSVNGSWDKNEIKKELEYLKSLGYEVIPKLNFSAGHDVWLGEYSRMVSTSVYYKVCADLIKEVCEVFRPKYFHLGMDEETAFNQEELDYCVIRQNDLWWHDLYYLIDCVEKENARPWIWSDYMWSHRDEFLKKCPKEVIQSNWYYRLDFKGETENAKNVLDCFSLLDEHGFDQVPTGSNYFTDGNMEALVRYSSENLDSQKLLGFMQTPWVMTHNFGDNKKKIFDSVNELGRAKKHFSEK